MAMPPYQGVYAKINFPAYEYAEYPKRITVNGRRVTVASAHEEALAVASDPSSVAPVNPLAAERDALLDKIIELQAANEALIAKIKAPEQNGGAKPPSAGAPVRPSTISAPTSAKAPSPPASAETNPSAAVAKTA